MEGKKLYVGNLTYATTDTDLENLFGEYGTVTSANVISDRETGRSKGFAFIEMSDSTEAEKAMTALNGTDYNGRNLKIDEARPQQNRNKRRF